MNKHKQRGYLSDLTNFFLMLILTGFLLGTVAAYGVPYLWNFVKPYIHQMTR